MEYQNTDEATRREACKRVEQLAKAIIKIRKKYYLCFNKISAADQKRYDELKAQMQSVASENGLDKFNAQLISDIDTQFGEDMPNYTDENGNLSNGAMEDLHQKFVNAVAMQAELTILSNKHIDTDPKLANAYIKKAGMCQERAKRYEEILIQIYSKSRLDCDRRTVLKDKFGEQIKGDTLNFFEKVGYNEFTSKDPLMLEGAIEAINECMKKEEKTAPKLETEILQ